MRCGVIDVLDLSRGVRFLSGWVAGGLYIGVAAGLGEKTGNAE